jgi:hypothetical protein
MFTSKLDIDDHKEIGEVLDHLKITHGSTGPRVNSVTRCGD